jgi:C3HC zinc finger-like
MSYALESKKRKFNRVLDSISKPTTQTPSLKEAPDHVTVTSQPSIKKVRLSGGPDDAVSVKPSVFRVFRASSHSTTIRPNYVPWDRDRFLERLETFRRVDRWSPKPPAISEVEWAKRGWSCTDLMRVTCVGGCGRSVVVKIPDDTELEEESMGKVQERKEVRRSEQL